MAHLLIVEDDRPLAEGISMALKSDGISIAAVGTKKDGEAYLDSHSVDLVILDVNLPDGSGLDLLGSLRLHSSLPVILLTANDMETDIVYGLESGADDYITKPFGLGELRARVHARLRRYENRFHEVYCKDDFIFDFSNQSFSKNGETLELSKTEQKLLRLLVLNSGHVLPREILIDRIWGSEEFVDENALSVVVRRLRQKLEVSPSVPKHIMTAYGIGYGWEVSS